MYLCRWFNDPFIDYFQGKKAFMAIKDENICLSISLFSHSRFKAMPQPLYAELFICPSFVRTCKPPFIIYMRGDKPFHRHPTPNHSYLPKQFQNASPSVCGTLQLYVRPKGQTKVVTKALW